MGQMMAASHASYSACGLASEGTDLLVELVREAGPASGLYGAKITGGGSGGTVAILGRAGADAAVDASPGSMPNKPAGKLTFFAARRRGLTERPS